ncbi:MAG: transporter [Pseudomonadota bacterium]
MAAKSGNSQARPFKGLLVLGLGIASSHVSGAPITFNTALPVAKGDFVFRELIVASRSGHDPTGVDRDFRGTAAVTALGYGMTSNLALFGVLPYVDNKLELTAGGQRVARAASGFGDLSLFGRHTVVRRDDPGRTVRIAPFAGIKVPTGDDDERDAFGRLPPAVQSGSGSWDAFAGVVATYQTLDFQVDSQVSYLENNGANGFEAGDVARLDASLQYRLWPRALFAGVPAFVYGVIELNLIQRGKNRAGGKADPDSGGTTLFLTPGLQYVTRRWIFEAGVQWPVVQNLRGTALETDYVLHAGFRFNY